MHVLMAVSMQALNEDQDMCALDGTCLNAHLWMLRGRLAAAGVSCAREELVHSVRCVAEVLLQMTARLLQVRARRRGFHCSSTCLALAAFAGTGSYWKHAS